MNKIRTGFILAGKILLLAVTAMALLFAVCLAAVLIGLLTGRSVDQMLALLSETAPWTIIVQDAVIVASVLILYALYERKKGWSLGFTVRRGRAVRETIAGLVFGAALITAAVLLIWLLGGIRIRGIEWNAGVARALAEGIAMFAVVAISEELLARGYLYGLIRFSYGTRAAIAVTSLLFALLHFGNDHLFDSPWAVLNLILVGVLFGALREWSGGLWIPVGLHMAWNYFQGYVYGFEVSGVRVESLVRVERAGSEAVSGGSFGAEGSAVTTLVLAAGWLAAFLYYRSRGRAAG